MEENNNELDNLIIQSDKPSGLKKLLLAAAILLLVLIIIILVTKSLIQTDEKPQSSIILPPEPAMQTKTETKEPLFEEVPIEEEKESGQKVDQVIEKVKNQQAETAAEPKPAETPAEPKEPVVKKSPAPTPAPQKPKSAPKTVATGNYFIQVGAFFRYPPDKKFLKSIEKEGLHYVIAEGTKSGTPYKKVMVGPYPSRAAAKKDLDRVKRRINQNAYITKK